MLGQWTALRVISEVDIGPSTPSLQQVTWMYECAAGMPRLDKEVRMGQAREVVPTWQSQSLKVRMAGFQVGKPLTVELKRTLPEQCSVCSNGRFWPAHEGAGSGDVPWLFRGLYRETLGAA